MLLKNRRHNNNHHSWHQTQQLRTHQSHKQKYNKRQTLYRLDYLKQGNIVSFLTLALTIVLLISSPSSYVTFVVADTSASRFVSFQTLVPIDNQRHKSSKFDSTRCLSVKKAMKVPLEKLTTHANSYAAAHGLQVQVKQQPGSSSSTSTMSSASYQCAPISLLPNAFPHSAFQSAQILAPDFNLLVDRISQDGDFLTKTLGGEHGVISKDEYTRKLLELYTDIYMDNVDDGDGGSAGGQKKPNFAKEADVLGIHRSDYMLHPLGESEGGGYGLKQVELNTIAASFAGLATNVAGLHKMLTERFAYELKEWLEINQKVVMGSEYTPSLDVVEGVPTNPALVNLPKAMSVAHQHYQSRFGATSSDGGEHPIVILFVVQEGETNTVDQRMLEFQLWNNHQIPVVRMSLTKAKSQLQLDQDTGALYILPDVSDDGSYGSVPLKSEVSVAYFRAGYAPTDYPDGYDGIEWQARELIERSRATKCPQLGYHLAGTKKVQQELARPGVLERFFERDGGEGDEVLPVVDLKQMRAAFAGLYSLGEDAVGEDLLAVKAAISGNEGLYVLKPQREGGGYNYYGEKLAKKLKENITVKDDGSLTLGDDLAEFILMQRLFPPKQRAILLRGGLVEGTGDSISELGCFGTIVRSHDGKILQNEYAGFLLRTKFSNVDEGGVASGFATLSSPYLC